MVTNLPDIYTGTAFNAEPFDLYAVPVWTDLSARYYGTSSASKGRTQYELGQAQTGQGDVTWHDADEALNPANASSPYAPNVVPYRPFLWRMMWPQGGTGNVLGGAGYDGSFESYTTTAQVIAWLASIANYTGTAIATLALTTGGAWQGTKCVTMTANPLGPMAGASFTVALIPGRVYTAQCHVNINAAAAPFQLAVGNQTIAVDVFTRTVSSAWGTPTYYGPTWTITGTAANMSVSGGLAFMSLSAVSARMAALTTASRANQLVQDSDQWVTVTVPVVTTGTGNINVSMWSRYIDPANNLECLLSFGPGGIIVVSIIKGVAAVFTTLATVTLSDPYAAGDSYRIHSHVSGADVNVKVWKVTVPIPEPLPWTLITSDSAVSAPGQVGVTGLLGTGNTNTLPVVLTFSDYRAIGSIVDTATGVTSTSGSYQLLSNTFTATQPQHTFQAKTQGSPSSPITVLLDGFQVEPGSSANTFTTAGPIIRSPWTRGYIERWPFRWDADSRGYLGIMSGPVVGPFFQLANVTLHAEARGSIMAKAPRYLWPLNESGDTTTVFGEQSGNGGPLLNRWDALEGPAGTFAPGTASNLVGDPNGVGVSITGQLPGLPTACTILHSGYKVGQVVPFGSVGATWGVTLSCWASSDDTTTNLTGDLVTASVPAFGAAFFGMDIGSPFSGVGPALGVTLNGAFFSTPRTAVTFNDGNVHHFAASFNLGGNAYFMAMYVDGVLYGSRAGTASTDFGSSTLDGRTTSLSVNGSPSLPGVSASADAGINGLITLVALWNRALSSAEVADLGTAGRGYPNENSGTRVARYLALAGFPGVADVGQGLTTMGPSALAEGTEALSAILEGPTETEFGVFGESQEGVLWRGRQARYLTTTSSYTFGENAGEYPYLGDISYDDDATYVYNSAVITRLGGAVVSATDTTGRSQMRYAARTFTRTVGGNSDLEAQDAATYVVANFKDARPRLAALRFDAAATRGVSASADGTLWPMVLTLEQGMRVTVKRRAKAANGGAGLTLSADFFIEGITPGAIDPEAGTAEWVLLMSPVPVTSQPWILEDATYGQLDVTTVLGF